jgi:hypothetical protein
VSERKPYPSDLSDARWALIEPTLTAWRKARLDRRPTGQPAKVDLRDVFNAILYVNRTGIPWKYLPHDSRTMAPSMPTTPHGGTKESTPTSTARPSPEPSGAPSIAAARGDELQDDKCTAHEDLSA